MRFIPAVVLCASALFAQQALRRAPGFALPDSHMEIHDLYDYRGKPVVLEFMQTTCPHCATFVGVLQRIQQKYGDKVAILSVANPPDNITSVNMFISGHKITYPILFDTGQAAFSYVRSPRFDLPQVYVIDANGMIFAHHVYSLMDRDIFEGNGLFNELDKLVKK
ncbi:MAG TPA: TlpA disulfide reductase family protein [Bryobacteraceae bacterium]|nr:TlpA disulfide reductase family protein [Bryobacteraceae bacterium]